MKVLLVSTSSGSRGGGELSLLYIGRALRDRGHELTLWLSTHPRMDELAAAFSPIGAVIRAPYTNTYDRRGRSLSSWADILGAMRIAKAWRALAPDVIHLNKQNLEDGLDLVEAARRSRLPCLTMMHITQSAQYLRASFAAPRDFVSRRALQKFPGLLVTTPGSRERDLAEFVGAGARIRTVDNGVPIPPGPPSPEERESARSEIGAEPGDLLCMAVGRMVPQKRPLLFLELASQIHRQIPHARFCWVGDGPLAPEWDSWVAGYALGKVIRRLPWQNDVPRLLGAADVFLHVADFEGLAFAILEALAAGLPCAITPNLLAEMPFLDTQNSIAIADDGRWIETLKDRQSLAEIGRTARQLAEAKFSYARMAADYEALYRECAAQRR